MFIIGLPAVILLSALIIFISARRSTKSTEKFLQNSFGTVREHDSYLEQRMDNVAALFIRSSKDVPGECIVDDIAWNDLGMDGIFALADHTDSFAGEQCLYSGMRILSRTTEDTELREKLITLYDSDDSRRLAVRKILYGLGKPISSYDIPDIAEDIKSLHMPGAKLFPVQLAALILTGIGAAVTKSSELAGICMVIYLFNIVQHLRLKARSEGKMNLVFTMSRIISSAESICRIVPESADSVREPVGRLKRAAAASAVIEQTVAPRTTDDITGLFYDYVLGGLMLDLIVYERTVSRLENSSQEFMELYRFVGRTDCAIAIASFRRSLEHYCIPVSGDLRFSGLVHPAIPGAVPNDLDFRKNIILTGSNASGKSTFIKAAAINIILAHTLNTCTAASASVPECGVATSMAVRDDILSGESYYIREIRYIKRMADLCSGSRMMFLAIDEILRGTNTRERIAASKAVLRYFGSRNCILIAATHDIELAYALDSEFDNYYFTETLKDGDVVFDYTIRPGISTTSNAIRLLGAVGFPEEIIFAALKELEE